MADRIDNFINRIRGPEVTAAAVGYAAGMVGFEFATPYPDSNVRPLHNAEDLLVGLATSIAAGGLTMIIRSFRERSNESRPHV